jgi:hypothetical protein
LLGLLPWLGLFTAATTDMEVTLNFVIMLATTVSIFFQIDIEEQSTGNASMKYQNSIMNIDDIRLADMSQNIWICLDAVSGILLWYCIVLFEPL